MFNVFNILRIRVELDDELPSSRIGAWVGPNGQDFFACVYITLVMCNFDHSFLLHPEFKCLFIYLYFFHPSCMIAFFLPFKILNSMKNGKGVNFWKSKEILRKQLSTLIAHSMVEIFHFLTKCLFLNFIYQRFNFKLIITWLNWIFKIFYPKVNFIMK
jgi:hypothetical protein